MHMLATPDHEAYFDFCSNVIQLKVYDSAYRDAFQRAISWEPGDLPLVHREADFRALLKHEVTHFLDLTTTSWGRQYCFRKLRFIDLLRQGDPATATARQVFAVESGEIELHASLVRPGKVPPADCATIQNQLVYTEEYGVCLLLHYVRGTNVEHSVPVSTLSLLEANATAGEFLSLLQCADAHRDVVERRLTVADIQRRFDNLLNDPARLEYAALLHVTRVHFSDLGLRELLALVSALARFALDLPDMEMSMLANPIERSFMNKELGYLLAMELRRGSHRQLIYFKSVLCLYGWLQSVGSSDRESCRELIRSSPEAAVRRMWNEAFGMELSNAPTEFDNPVAVHFETLMDERKSLADGRILAESRAHNAGRLRSSSAGLLSFRDLRLMDGLFADGEPLRFPNRMEIDAVRYVDDHMDVLTQLDAEYRSMSHARIHIPPGTPRIQL